MEREGSTLNRRGFLSLGTLGMAAVMGGLACNPSEKKASSAAMNMDTISPAKIAVQLWTVRELIEKDAKATLKRLAEIGYVAVETAFFPEHISITQGAQMIRDAGLEVCSVHVEIPQGKEKDRMLEMAEAYDCKRMVWHGWPEEKRYKSKEGIKELADVFNESYAFAASHGLSFGLHNHWWEFEPLPTGELPFVVLREQLDTNIFFEIDTYWAKVAGQDPAKIVADFGQRAPLLHIKDGPARWNPAMDKDEPEPMTAVGKGTQDFPAIVHAAAGHTEWMIVELDNCATDMMTAVEESYDYLIKNRLATGTVGA